MEDAVVIFGVCLLSFVMALGWFYFAAPRIFQSNPRRTIISIAVVFLIVLAFLEIVSIFNLRMFYDWMH